MNNDQKLVALLLTDQDIDRLMMICHDSSAYWHNHWQKAADDSAYFLSKTGCEAVKRANKRVVDKIETVYFALKAKAEEEAAELQEEQEIDSPQNVNCFNHA